MRNAFRILIRKQECKETLLKTRFSSKDSFEWILIKHDGRMTGFNWLKVRIINLSISPNVEIFLTR